jgi:hypothetical protein
VKDEKTQSIKILLSINFTPEKYSGSKNRLDNCTSFITHKSLPAMPKSGNACFDLLIELM